MLKKPAGCNKPAAAAAPLKRPAAVAEHCPLEAASAPPKATFSHEASRQQYQCRQGKGKGSTAMFRYSGSDPESKAQALALAQKWCDDRNR